MTGYMLTVTHGNETTVIQVFKQNPNLDEIRQALKRNLYVVKRDSVLLKDLFLCGNYTTKQGVIFRIKKVGIQITEHAKC